MSRLENQLQRSPFLRRPYPFSQMALLQLIALYVSSQTFFLGSLFAVHTLQFFPVRGTNGHENVIEPLPRTGHIAIGAFQKSLLNGFFLFGGSNPMTEQYYNDLWEYDRKDQRWTQLEIQDVPEPRRDAAVASISPDLWCLTGGRDARRSFSDILLFSVPKSTWLRGVVTEANKQFMPRSGHAMASDGLGNVYIFGGMSEDGKLLSDLWSVSFLSDTPYAQGADIGVDLNQYILPQRSSNQESSGQYTQTGDIPSGRTGHSLTRVGDSFYLLGGFQALHPGEYIEECTVYKLRVGALDAAAAHWERIQQAPPCPSFREGHVAVRHGLSLILSGGCDTRASVSKCFNDLWQYDIKQNTWIDLSQSYRTALYSPRMNHKGVVLSGSEFLITGGSRLEYDIPSSNSFMAGMQLPDSCPDHCNAEAMKSWKSPCIDNQCSCEAGFYGHDCGDLSFLGNSISIDVCHGHGQLSADGRCECFLGFTGIRCEKGNNRCINNCSGHGTCNTKSQCECEAGYMDIDCSVLATCPNLCCKRGRCKPSGECKCDEGWFGTSCSTSQAQIAGMRNEVKSARDQLYTILSKAAEAKNTVEHAAGISTVPSELANKALENQFQRLRGELEAKLQTIPEEISDEDIARTFFETHECVAAPNARLDSLFVLSSRPTGALEAKAKEVLNRPFSATGQTATEQNELRILHSAQQGMHDHVLPPGPGDVALEDVYDQAEKMMASHSKKQEVKKAAPPVPIGNPSLESNESFGVLSAGAGVSNVPLKNAVGEYSATVKCLLGLFYICIGVTSIFLIYRDNTERKERRLQANREGNGLGFDMDAELYNTTTPLLAEVTS